MDKKVTVQGVERETLGVFYGKWCMCVHVYLIVHENTIQYNLRPQGILKASEYQRVLDGARIISIRGSLLSPFTFSFSNQISMRRHSLGEG